MYIHKHMRTHTEYIKKTMKSGHRAIYRLNIFFLFFFFFTLCLKENFSILQSSVGIIYTALMKSRKY